MITEKEELEIYRSLLVRLHTAGWTGNTETFKKIMEKIGAYSYARTNSNFGETQEEEEGKWERTLLALKEL